MTVVHGMLAVDASGAASRTTRQTLEKMSVSESAVRGRHVASPADINRNRNPVRHRVFKTVCLYVSFGTMVRQLEIATKLRS